MTFATKLIWHYPPHLRHVATLPWEIINSKFLHIWKKTHTNCILIASYFVIHPQILIFSVFKNSESFPKRVFPILIANTIFHGTVFTCLLLRSICGTKNSSQQTSLQCLSTFNMLFSNKDKSLIKKMYLKGYTAERLTKECPEKSWTKLGANKLLKKLRDTVKLTGGQAAAAAQWKCNNYAFVCLMFQIFC